MAPRWIGTRCRPIDISDAVGYLIGCENPRTAGGEFDIQAEPEGTARRGVANRSRTDCVQSFPRHACLPRRRLAKPGLKNSPPRGWRNCSPGRLPESGMPALPRRYSAAKRGRGIARRGGGEQLPGRSRAGLPPAGARWPDARRRQGEGAEGVWPQAPPHHMRAHPVACRRPRLAPQVAAALARRHAHLEGVRSRPRKARQAREWFRKVPSRLPRPCRSRGHSPPWREAPEQGARLHARPPRGRHVRARCRDPRR